MEGCVGGEVCLDCCVVVADAGECIAYVVDDSVGTEEIGLVFLKIFLNSWAEEGIIGCAIAGAGVADASEIASKDLFLEAVDGIGDAFKVLENCYIFRYRCASAATVVSL